MAGVTALCLDEPVRLESGKLIELYARLGETGAESVVARALEEICARVAEMERLSEGGQFRAIAMSSTRLTAVAERIGMKSMSAVAADVLRAALSGDRHGLAATLARLFRIADKSIGAVNDLGRAIS